MEWGRATSPLFPMRVKIISNPITPLGSFSRGDILNSGGKFTDVFLLHLIECGAAEPLDYETKVDDTYEAKKKPQSIQLSLQAKASPVTTASMPRKRRKSSRSTTHGK